MLNRGVCRVWLGAALVAAGGCATVNPRADYELAGRRIAAATGQERVYDPDDEEAIADRVADLLRDGITSDETVQICLLNNPTLQAAFMDIGMARADVVQAQLLSNPSLGIALQFPAGGGLANFEAGLAQDIAALWQMPARKDAAERSLDVAVLEVARLAAGLAADAKVAYYEAVGADEHQRIAGEDVALAQSLLELSIARQEAGAASQLHVNLSKSLALSAEARVETARFEASEARRALVGLLGTITNADDLVFVDVLPEIPAKTPDTGRLLGLAREWRLDIRAARQAMSAAEAMLRKEVRGAWPTLELGLVMERGERPRSDGGRDLLADTARSSIANGRLTAPGIEPRSEGDRDTDFIIGPSLDLELPIFDQNQAQIAKARFAYEQARKMVVALERAAVLEISSALDQAATAWKLVRLYRERSLPLAQSNLELSREAYRAGRASFPSVLVAQRSFLETRRSFVSAAEAAAIAIPELERTVGLPYSELVRGDMPDATPEPATGGEGGTEP